MIITDKEYQLISDLIWKNYGIKLGDGKKALVLGRLQNLLIENNFKSFSDYYKYIISDKTGAAASVLMTRMTTNYTFFMREPQHFYFFRDDVLPYLVRSVDNRDIRIWSAGCSSGEEAYTLAMILQDFFRNDPLPWDTKVLATDISLKALETARKGEYKNKDIETFPIHWKNEYFRRIDGETCVVSDQIKNQVIYRSFNLMNASFPFKKRFHTIFCRNVMIYFDTPTKNDLVNRFYDYLEPGGYLFIGHSENLNHEESRFKYVMPAVYRK